MKKKIEHNKKEKPKYSIFGYAVLIFIFSMYFILIPILIFSWEAVLVFYGILALFIYSYWSVQIKEIHSSDADLWDIILQTSSGKRRKEEERRKRERDFANDENNYY